MHSCTALLLPLLLRRPNADHRYRQTDGGTDGRRTDGGSRESQHRFRNVTISRPRPHAPLHSVGWANFVLQLHCRGPNDLARGLLSPQREREGERERAAAAKIEPRRERRSCSLPPCSRLRPHRERAGERTHIGLAVLCKFVLQAGGSNSERRRPTKRGGEIEK